MAHKRSKYTVTFAAITLLFLFIGSWFVIVFYPGMPGSKHVGGLVNIGISIGTVLLLSMCDPRWSLYEEVIEEQNISVALVFGMFIIAAAIATPSSIL